ncbi:MAG: dithiol-disulfide isomerase [Syntrophus sp. (in: bacteria)]|nr:dithiol-disulfide isomerase [Syntrophus sp. (in: bacteria)]
MEKLRKHYEVEIQWKAFPLHPETPEEGLTLEELFAGRNIDIPQAMARLKKAAKELGLPLGDRKKTYNSRLAQEMGKWAETKGKGDEFQNAVFRAYFVDGKNIAKIDALVGIAAAVGLPEKEADEILQTRAFREAVDSDWALCERMGISAVPTFVLDHQSLAGAQPYETLEQLLLVNGVKRK